MALSNEGMPKDPFGMESSQDLTQFAAGCYAMYTSLVAAGFAEMQALRMTIYLMASMINAQHQAAGNGGTGNSGRA